MTATPTSSGGVSVQLCPGGPMLVRGASQVQDDTGAVHAVERPVVALCRCRRSQRKPWCDNSHKQSKRKEDPP